MSNSDAASREASTSWPPSLLALPTYLLGRLGRLGQRLTQQAIAEYGLMPAHFSVLITLDDFGPLAQHDVAARLGLNRSHLVHYVDDLESRKAIRRERDPEDRRRQLISLTPVGQRLLAELRGPIGDLQERLLGVLSAEERAVLLELLVRLVLSQGNETADPSGGASPNDT